MSAPAIECMKCGKIITYGDALNEAQDRHVRECGKPAGASPEIVAELLAAHEATAIAEAELAIRSDARDAALRAVLAVGGAHANANHPAHDHKAKPGSDWWFIGPTGALGLSARVKAWMEWCDAPAEPRSPELGQSAYDRYWEYDVALRAYLATRDAFASLWETKIGPLPRAER